MDEQADDLNTPLAGVEPIQSVPTPEYVFRGAPMVLVQMYFAQDIARSAVNALGELRCVHFRDLNEGLSTFQRQFVTELRRLDDYFRAVGELEHLTRSSGLIDDFQLREPLLPSSDVQQLGNTFIADSEKLRSLKSSYDKLVERRMALVEEREVLRASESFFGHSSRSRHQSPVNAPNHGDEDPLMNYTDDLGASDDEFDVEEEDPFADQPEAPTFAPNGMVVLAGTVDTSKSIVLERLSWRATRGNLYFRRQTLPSIGKDVFMVYTHGKESSKRVRRLAESLDCRISELSTTGRDRRVATLNSQIEDLDAVCLETAQMLQVEKDIVKTRLSAGKAVLVKEKRIQQTLNLCSTDNTRQGLLAEGWIPAENFSLVQKRLSELSAETAQLAVVHQVQTHRTPPTYHTTNKVTAAFQAMVDVYGIARHDEVNPGLPTVITFPFMFAVMFGDLGHGFVLTLGALVLVLKEKRIGAMRERDELFDMAFQGRYVLLLMGLFAMFTGVLYNDLFSMSMTIFGSAFEYKSHSAGETVVGERVGRRVYPIGLDWAWHGAENNLRFTNSYKMKLSVLLGFVHMTYSLCFQLVNAKNSRSFVDVWGNFVPSMLFMQSIFGYLSLTIVYKWSVDWIGHNRQPPGLLDMLINMFLAPGKIDVKLYSGQAVIQCFLVVIALVCVPWLLLFKPLYIRRQQKSGRVGFAPLQLDEHTFAIDEDEGNELHIADEPEEVHDHHSNESFGDIMIHQVIHTIEFCLNCISHTASYLRLWALSLAHNQLSQVLWNMTLKNAFGPTGGMGIVMVVVLFGAWFTITVLVLVCMEGTSAMLHALRLHWVEAMSKHFVGEGYAFVPLDLFSTAE